MRTFRTSSATALPDAPGFTEFFAGIRVDLKLSDALSSVGKNMGSHIVASPVIIPEQGGINASVIDENRIAPFPVNVIRVDNEVDGGIPPSGDVAVYVGGDHVKAAVMIPDRRGINSAGRAASHKLNLAFPGQHMADLLPADQISAVEDWNAGKKLEGAVHQIEILSYTADTGIGIESWDDGVSEFHGCSFLSSNIIPVSLKSNLCGLPEALKYATRCRKKYIRCGQARQLFLQCSDRDKVLKH